MGFHQNRDYHLLLLWILVWVIRSPINHRAVKPMLFQLSDQSPPSTNGGLLEGKSLETWVQSILCISHNVGDSPQLNEIQAFLATRKKRSRRTLSIKKAEVSAVVLVVWRVSFPQLICWVLLGLYRAWAWPVKGWLGYTLYILMQKWWRSLTLCSIWCDSRHGAHQSIKIDPSVLSVIWCGNL